MSFSGTVKEELAKHTAQARHCQVAELAALLYHCGRIEQGPQGMYLTLQTENEELIQTSRILLQELFGIPEEASPCGDNNSHRSIYTEADGVLQILQATHFAEQTGKCSEMHFSELILKSPCCKRAFLRGSYLAAGSMSDPEKNYHLEFVCDTERQAKLVLGIIGYFDIAAKIVARKKYFVVYIKEGESIVDILNVMEAHVALMEFENMRIVKEMRNSINRKVNCEAANITKTVNAAAKQVADIELIRDHGGLEQLPPMLLEIAALRLENPDLPLKDLGELAEPPVGKSGVNHRLKKLGEIADRIRMQVELGEQD